MRKYRLLQGMIIAASACLVQGTAVGGSTGQDCKDDVTLVVTQPQETAPPIAPVAAKTEVTPRTEREPVDSGDRTRMMSYIILRGLQGAGPFLGGR